MREFQIRAHYEHTTTFWVKFEAPDLLTAFKYARGRWPGADSWETK